MNKLSLIIILFLSNLTNAASWNGRIFRSPDRTEISSQEFLLGISNSRIIVMGENHITPEVQEIERRIIQDVIKFSPLKINYALAWEFLAYSHQPKTEELFNQFRNKIISGENFIKNTVGSAKNNTYIPVLQAVAESGGALIGINLTRDQKSPVTKGGIKSADPTLIPPGYEIGGGDYFERFVEAMGGHTTGEKLNNYFDAQCLTDDVMAHQVSQIAGRDKIFIIAGHFHTDYYDGFIHRLEVRLPGETKSIVRIVDASEFTEDQLLGLLRHPKYGQLADYVYFVKEPKTNQE